MGVCICGCAWWRWGVYDMLMYVSDGLGACGLLTLIGVRDYYTISYLSLLMLLL